ncbi:hypothetical protein GH714_025126 [Hevea brasiliensis]|uniref:Uncharacterized protein n=1 Tax=Hevea brasiliensis TaxID=3981 RepID=A0A6A6M5B6_HEVBR|nr:hypothetical protein GH714_025126 [Hevea brasiliensis]
MEAKSLLFFAIILFNFGFLPANTLQTYIVQLHPHGITRSSFASKFHWHLSFLGQTISSEVDCSSRLLYSYRSAMEGFAAQLSKSELELLQKLPDVIAIRPDRRLQVHTTYSYKFLGLNPIGEGAWYKSRFGSGTIIGVLDTGIWPESPSFNDQGMPPVPKKWRGICQEGQDFNSSNCNKKLIGARFFTKGHRVASTSTSSKHSGIFVTKRFSRAWNSHIIHSRRSFSSNGKCVWYWSWYCTRDGSWLPYCNVQSLLDSIAIGSFRAVEHGISVICAAGNNGPLQNSVANEAPWIATVGASTLDRKFPAIVRLGNGQFLYGESMYPGNQFSNTAKELELVYVTSRDAGSEFCFRGSLPPAKVRGKMVVCDRGVNGRAEKSQAVKESGGAAMILANTEINLEEDSVDVHVLPATLIGFAESVSLKAYVNSTNIIAPGVNIIAAWPQNLGPTGLPEDPRRVNFTVMSGTSMACPHVSGIAALIRSAHPKWTPAAVKSAIMTTADITDHSGNQIMDGNKPAEVFAIGAGQVNPERAINPGLIYDIRPEEYVTHLCTLGYTRSEIFTITHRNVSCNELLQMNKGFSLNYPSISVIFKHGMTSKLIRRRLTNVGSSNSIYSVEVTAPEGVKVRVKPQRLVFRHINQSLSYRVWFISRKTIVREKESFAQGHLTWVHSQNNLSRVRSPFQ